MKTIHRDTAAAYITSSDGKILFGRKDPAKGGVYADCWHIPGGGIDDGETPEQAIIREVREETGIDISTAERNLIDDAGQGESLKIQPDGERVTVSMTFAIYRVKLASTAAAVQLPSSDDLIDLTWFDFNQLADIKMTPPAYVLFDRIGMDWLKN